MPEPTVTYSDVYTAHDWVPVEMLWFSHEEALAAGTVYPTSKKASASYNEIHVEPGCIATETLYAALDTSNYVALPLGHSSVHGVVMAPGMACKPVSNSATAVVHRSSASYNEIHMEPGCIATETLYAALDPSNHVALPLGHSSVHGVVMTPGMACKPMRAATMPTLPSELSKLDIKQEKVSEKGTPLGLYSVHGLLARPCSSAFPIKSKVTLSLDNVVEQTMHFYSSMTTADHV